MTKIWGAIGKGVEKANYLSAQAIFWLFIFIGFLWTADAICRALGITPFGTVSIGLGKYLTIICAYFTAGYATYALGMVRVSVITQRLNERTRAWVDLYAYSYFLFFAFVFTYFFFRWAQYAMAGGERTSEIEAIQVWWVFAACTVGLVLFSAQIIREIVRHAQRIASGQLAKGTKFYTQPYFIVPLFVALIGLSFWVTGVNMIAGFFTILFLMMFTSVPMPAALGSIAIFGLWHFGGDITYLKPIAFLAFYYLSDPTWMAMPMFMLGGVLFGAGMAAPLYRTIRAWVGWIPGGMAVATIWIAAVFGAIIGSQFAALAALIYFCLPELDKDGFPREFTLPLIVTGVAIAILIPPSITLVLFGLITETSIGGCLFSGIGSGLLLTILCSIYIVIWAVRKGKVARVLPGWKERFASIPPAIVPLLAPVILIGGMMSGLFTATEASCFMMVYILIASVAMRQIKGVRAINSMGPELTRTLGYIALVIVCIGPISKCLVYYQIPQMIAAWVIAAGLTKWGMFAFLMIFCTLMGCVGEVFVIMIVLLPLLLPTIEALGIHPYWLAAFFTIQVPLGGLTPPVGGLVFICANIVKVDPYFIFKGILPWLVMDLLCLTILFLFPPIATWIPLSLGFTP